MTNNEFMALVNSEAIMAIAGAEDKWRQRASDAVLASKYNEVKTCIAVAQALKDLQTVILAEDTTAETVQEDCIVEALPDIARYSDIHEPEIHSENLSVRQRGAAKSLDARCGDAVMEAIKAGMKLADVVREFKTSNAVLAAWLKHKGVAKTEGGYVIDGIFCRFAEGPDEENQDQEPEPESAPAEEVAETEDASKTENKEPEPEPEPESAPAEEVTATVNDSKTENKELTHDEKLMADYKILDKQNINNCLCKSWSPKRIAGIRKLHLGEESVESYIAVRKGLKWNGKICSWQKIK